MPADNQKLLDLLQLQAAPVGEKTPFCPDDETIASFFEGHLPQPRRELVTRHVSDCRYCRGRLGMIRRLQDSRADWVVSEEFKARAKQVAGSRARGRWKQAPIWAAAATILLAVGVWIDPSNDPSNPTTETTTNIRERRSIDTSAFEPRILSPVEGSSVEVSGLQIRWTQVAGSLHYELFIVTDTGDLLLHERTEDTQWQAIAPLPLKLGQEYYVRVEAYLEDASIVSSPHVLFAVKGDD